MEQYLWFFVDYRQKNCPEWLTIAEFAVHNKTHLATKVCSFMANYGRKMRMEADVRRKEKVEKAIKFVKRIKKVQKDVRHSSYLIIWDLVRYLGSSNILVCYLRIQKTGWNNLWL